MSRKFSNFADILTQRALEQSPKIAFTFLSDGETEAESLTYQQLEQQARAIAAVLKGLNAQDKRALLLYPPGLEFISAFFGCLYAGVIAVPAYPPRPNRSLDRLQAIVSDASATFALTTQSLLSTIEGRLMQSTATEAIRCVTTDNIALELADGWQKLSLSEDKLAFLQYTSGSTGIPKGVMVSHSNLLHNSGLINQCFQNTPDSSGVSWLPPYHDMGLIGGILQPIYVGVSMVLMPPVAFLQRPFRWLQAISHYRATTSGAPNFAYDLCVNQITLEQRETVDLRCWKLAFTGAEPVRAQTLEQFAQAFADCGFRKTVFYPCYGMAETTLLVSGGQKEAMPILKTFQGKALEQNQVLSASESEPGSITLVGCGQAVDPQQVSIVNPETLTCCRPDEIGEIWVRGESVAQGYWNRKTQTEETFKAYLADTQAGPFLRTGDLGFLQEGELFVTGRLKDLIIIRGRNHYPQDLELTTEKSDPAIREGCGAAFSIDVAGEERLVIVYEVKRSYLRKLDLEKVASSIRKAILQTHELQPFAIALLKTGSIPKTSSGKIQRHASKASFLQSSLEIIGAWREGKSEVGSRNSERDTGDMEVSNLQPSTFNLQPNNQQQTIQGWMVANIAQRLGVSPQEIDVREPFASYGLDSVQAVRLSAELEDWLERKLPPTLVYDYPTIETLAQYLGSQKSEVGSRKLEVGNQNSLEPIAIIGMGCRLPGADNPDTFWQLLRNGKDAITRLKGRWQGDTWGGFLNQVDQFAAPFFGISPREANEMDPQQRLLLEVTWEALERAGIAADQLAGSATGVFIGISSSDYSQLRLQNHLEPDAYAGTGNAHSIAANRLSYSFDFRGPSLTVDTACSSSLVAVHLAMRSLQSYESSLAIAGGVNLLLTPELTLTFSQAGMMATDGRCKTFDASADGYVRGEGCGVIVLKRLSEAIRDGDNILALIRGSAINQDGRSNGLTAPNGIAQQAVIRQALENAGVEAAQISYVESHGTGTSLGDPIEVNSLKTVLMQGRSLEQPLWLGSVKTNIGHLEAAAGIAGLMKIVLSFQHQEIPPHLHFNTLNPLIDLDNTPLSIPTEIQLWTSSESPRLAGVSSFGFGGTNAHVVLEEVGSRKSSHCGLGVSPSGASGAEVGSKQLNERPLQLLTLSAKSEMALQDLVKAYEKYLTSEPERSLADICFTANTGRSHFNHRLALITNSIEQLQQELATFRSGEISTQLISGTVDKEINQKIAFLFTGQGSQFVNMGYQLYQTQPTFRAVLDCCAEILQPYLDKPLLKVLYPELGNRGIFTTPHTLHPTPASPSSPHLLDETIYTQPALFALEYALAQLWLSWGIKPSVVMGHSVGEYVAACLAGVFSLEDGLSLIARRAKLMQALPQVGEMVAVFTDEATVQVVIQPDAHLCSIAAINGSQSIVISGEKETVSKVVNQLKDKGVKTRKLNVSHAFHSPLMEPMLAKFEEVAHQIQYSTPRLDIISNLTGEIAGEEIATPQYWINHVRQPVKFSASIELLAQQGYQIFLEVGPKPTLLGMGRSILEVRSQESGVRSQESEGQNSTFNLQPQLWLPSLRPGQDDWQQLLHSLATLSVQGIEIDWKGFEKNYQRNRVVLPTYPFQRQRYWIENKEQEIQHSEFKEWLYQVVWQPKSRIEKELNPELLVQKAEAKGSWLIFADQKGIGKTLAQQLQSSGQHCLLVYPGESYTSPLLESTKLDWQINPAHPEDFQRLFQDGLSKSPQLKGIIHLWGLEATDLDLDQAQCLGCESVLYLIQALTQQAISAQLWLITRGTQTVHSQEVPSVASASLWGLGKVIALEHPEYWGGMIDLATHPDLDEATLLLREIINPDGEAQIAFRKGQRYVSRLAEGTRNKVKRKSLNLNSEFSYLITGGLGALGLKVAQWLVEEGARNLVLIGRNQPSSRASQILKALEEKGVKVLVAQADVSNQQELARVVETIKTSMPPLRGIVHAAGVLEDGFLAGLSGERFRKVMNPKVKGVWNLHQLTEDIALDFFVMFSSAASLLGSPGQGNYAAANAFLDAIAYYRQARGLPALSINWGPLSDGMATSTRLAVKGLNPIKTEQGLQALAAIISEKTAQVGIVSVNWTELSQQFPYLVQSPYFQEIVNNSSHQSTKAIEKPKIFEQLLALQPSQREEFLITYLQFSIAQIMQMNGQSIAPTDNLLDLGCDSMMVMEAINQLKGDLQLMLYPREFYERPRIDALAKYLATEFERSYGQNSETSSTVEVKTQQVLELTSNPHSSWSTGGFPNPPLPTSDFKKLPAIAFILSSPRAGSTLLRVMLAGHPDLASPPELHLLPFNTMAERDGELALSHLGEGLQRAFIELKGIDAPASQKLLEELVQQNRSIQEVYAILQELAGKRLLVDKSPTYAFHRETLERAEALFTGAKYIHLVRHPYAVIESFCRLRMDKLISSGEANPYQLAESIWAQSNQNIVDFSRQIEPERYHLLHYEALVKEPERVMEELCQFLGVSFDSSVLQPYEGQRMTDGVYDKSMSVGDPNFLKRQQIDPNLADAWREIELPHPLREFAHRVAVSLNYELPHQRLKEGDKLQVNNQPMPHLLTQYSMDENWINVRGLNLCLCTWGPENGSLVLCLHGILEQGAAWSEVAVRLAEQGYRVIAPDLRGHGRSAHVGLGGSYNLLDFLGDIDAIVEHFSNQPFILVGHSLGSVIAAMYASIRPQKVKNLILVETVLPTEVQEDEAVEQLVTHLDYLASRPEHTVFPNVATAAERLRLATPALSELFAMQLAERITEPHQEGVCWRWDSLLRTRAGIGFNGVDKTRYLSFLRQIKAPITLIYGDNSDFNRPEDLAQQQKAMVKAKRIILSGGHNLHLEAAADLAKIISEYYSKSQESGVKSQE